MPVHTHQSTKVKLDFHSIHLQCQCRLVHLIRYMTAELFKIQSSTSIGISNFYKIMQGFNIHPLYRFYFSYFDEMQILKIKITGIHKVYAHKTDCLTLNNISKTSCIFGGRFLHNTQFSFQPLCFIFQNYLLFTSNTYIYNSYPTSARELLS